MVIFLIIAVNGAVWGIEFPSLQEFKSLNVVDQTRYLSDAGCYEGRVGNMERLKEYTKYLNEKYGDLSLYNNLTEEEWFLIVELLRANSCAGDEITECKLMDRILDYIPIEFLDKLYDFCDLWRVMVDDRYSVEEVELVKDLMIKGMKRIVKRAEEEDYKRKNYLKFMYGRFLCETNLEIKDCARGLELMYSAALDEYKEKGVEGFDKELAEVLGGMCHYGSYAEQTKNIKACLLVAELIAEISRAGRTLRTWGPIKDPDELIRVTREHLSRWETETQKLPEGSILDEALAEEEKPPAPQPHPAPVTEPAPPTVTPSVPEKEPEVVERREAPPKLSPALPGFFQSLRFIVFVVIGVIVVVVVGVILVKGRKGSKGVNKE